MEVIGIEIASKFRGLYRKTAERMKTTITQVIACSILLIGSTTESNKALLPAVLPHRSKHPLNLLSPSQSQSSPTRQRPAPHPRQTYKQNLANQ